jgi:hypothetical protein
LPESIPTLIRKIEQLSLFQLAVACLCGILISFAIISFSPFPAMFSGPQDFTAFYLGARHVGTSLLYDPSGTAREQAIVTGASTPMLFHYVRLPFYAVFLRPLDGLPYTTALIIWKILSLAGLAAAALLVDTSPKVGALAISWSVAAMCTLKWGQDAWIPLLLTCGYFYFYTRNRVFRAGICIGLAIAMKPHVFLPFMFAAVAARQYRLLSAITASISAAFTLSFWAQGSHWPIEWVRMLALDAKTSFTSVMPTIPGVLGQHLASVMPFYGAVAAVVAMIAVLATRYMPFHVASAVAIILGVLGSAHSYLYDLLMLVPPCLLIVRATSSLQALAILTPAAQVLPAISVPLVGPAVTVSAGLWAVLISFRSHAKWKLAPHSEYKPAAGIATKGYADAEDSD